MSEIRATDRGEEIEQEGYTVIEDAFNQDELAKMRTAADRILELIVNSSLANDRTSGRLALVEDESGGQMVKKIQPVNDLSLTFTEISRDERLIEPMREFMDDEPRLMEEKLNYKQPLPNPIEGLDTNRPTDAWPPHSDWAYFRAQDYPQTVVSSAIALDDLTEANGTIRFWPGTNDEYIEHERFDNGLGVPEKHVDRDESELIEAPAGSLILFDSLVWHESAANTTESPRRLMIYSHFPASATQEFGIVEDERNGATRLNESPYEWCYQELKDCNEFADRFEAPVV